MYSSRHPYVARIELTLFITLTVIVMNVNSLACSDPITSFPIYENFESNSIENWIQDTNDDFNWSVRSSSTPSSGTGPSSAFDGSYYIYTEATSPNNPNKEANLISPCFTVLSTASTSLDFSYHMYGSGMGSFDVEISTDNGNTWTSLWGLSGNQGNSWLTQSISLNSYRGQDVQLRFHVITGTFRSDVSLDNVSITSTTLAEICDDNIDNDGDGYVDCEDLDCGMISNNQFDNSTSDWTLTNSSGNAGSFSIDNSSQISGTNAAKIEITSIGNQSSFTQFNHSNLNVEAGKTYRLYFEAKSDISREVQVILQQTTSPNTTLLSQDFSTANFNGRYGLEYTAVSSEADVDLVFNLGQATGTVWLDNVQFKEVCAAPTCIMPESESFTICEGEVLSNTVATNDLIPDEAFNVTYEITAQPGQGTVTLNNDGTFEYTPDADASGNDSFTYERCYSYSDDLGLENIIFNPCGEGKIIETFIEGLEGESSPSIAVANPDDFTKIIVEVWAESACGSVTIEGLIAEEFDLFRTNGQLDNERLYRVELTSISDDGLIDISRTGSCNLSSAAAYVERIQENGQGSSALIQSDIDLYHTYVSGDDCFVYSMPIGLSDADRDITFTIPLHEKDNTRIVEATVIAGSISESASTTSWSAIGEGAGEIEIILFNVPGDVSSATIEVCSPDNNGDSFGVGFISASSQLCSELSTFDCCAQATTSINIVSASIDNSSPSNCFDNGYAILTASNSATSGTNSYQWNHSAETSAQVIVTPTQTTSYIVTVTNSSGCVSTAETTVVVNPELTVAIDFNGSICLEDDSQLTANPQGGTAGFEYSWSGPNSFSSTSQTIDADISGNYYLTVTDAAGCTETTSAFIYEAYDPFIFTLNTEICEGESVDLEVNSSSAIDFQWDSNAGGATTSSVTVVPTPPFTEYVVTVTNDIGCQTTASAVIDVIAKPEVEITGASTICEGESSQLSPSTGGTWVSTNSSVAVVSNNGVVTGVGPGNTTFVFTNSSTLCSSNPTSELTVQAKPEVSIQGPDSICEGFTTQLSPSSGGTWTSNNPSIATVNNDGLVTGLTQGTATFFFTSNTTNCSSNSTLPITVNDKPIVEIVGSDSICVGSTTTLSPNGGGSWTSSDESIATVTNDGVVTAVSEGNVTFVFTSVDGCISSATNEVVIDPVNNLSITGQSVLCEEEVTTLNVNTIGGNWISSNTSIATIDQYGVVTAINSGTIEISYVGHNIPCTTDPSFEIEILDKPSIDILGSSNLCVGENTQLTTTGSGGSWSSSNSDVALVSTSGLVVAISAGTATFTYTNSNGCQSSVSEQITVDPSLDVIVDFNGSLCLEDDSQLSAIVTGGTSEYTYSWTGPGGFTSTTQVVDISLNGNYNLTVTDSKGCSSNTTAFVYEAYDPFIFALNTEVCEGEEITLSVNSASTVSYAWSANADNSTNSSVTVTPSYPSTTYTVTVTNGIGCTTEASASIDVNEKPQIDMSGPTTICQNTTVQLMPTDGGSWSSSDYNVATINNEGVVTGLTNGTATFTYIDNATGCYSDESDTLTVVENVSIDIVGETDLCIGESSTLDASMSGGSWISSNSAVVQVDLNGTITPMSAGSASILYTMSEEGCYEEASAEITVSNLPILSLNGPNVICENSQTFLSASTSGIWTSSDPSIASISNNGEVTGLSAGTVTFDFVSSVGCEETLSTPITVIARPVVSLDGPAEICKTEITNLLPSSGGIWISSNSAVASVNGTGQVVGMSAGTAQFTFVEFTNGCTSENTIEITVNDFPQISGLDEDGLCIGETTTITTADDGIWSSTNEEIAIIDSNGSITAVGPGSAMFTFTSNSTGCTSEMSNPLTVHDNPTVNFVGPNTICVGEESSIAPSSGGFWASSDVSIATVSEMGLITAISPGSANFTFTSDFSGCSSLPSENLVINQPAEITLLGDSILCIGSITELSPTDGGTWISSDENIATITNGGVVTGISPGEVSFTFDSNAGCISNPSKSVTITPDPIIENEGPDAICVGSTTTISASTTGIWVSSDTSVATINAQGIVLGKSPGSANFTFTDSISGCTATLNTPLNVSLVPVVTIAGSDEICIGSQTSLLPSFGGSWVSSDPSVAVIDQNGIVQGINEGSAVFTFFAEDSGCESSSSSPVVILPKPEIELTGSALICEGEQTSLEPTEGGSWISNNESVATITDEGIVTGVGQGLARFTFVSDEGCLSDESSPVIVIDKPVTILAGSNLLCTDETGQMFPDQGGSWFSTNPSVATIDNNGVFTAHAPGTVRFVYTDSTTGCISEPSEIVAVNDAPDIALIGPAEVCIGETTNLVPTSGGVWTSLNPDIATIQNNGQILALSPGTATFSFLDLTTGCTTSAQDIVTVNENPIIEFTGPQSLCIGEISSLIPNSGGTWMSTDESVATINDLGAITAVGQGSTRFLFTNTTSGCSSGLSESLVVNGKPTVIVAGPSTICIGSTSELTSGTEGNWTSLNPTIATIDSLGVVTGVSSGVAFFKFVDDLTGCESDVNTSITIQEPVGVEILGDAEICLGYTTQLSPISGGIWTSSNPAIATVSNSGVVTARAPGKVTFEFYDSNTGCVASSPTDPITVKSCTNHDFNVSIVNLEIESNLNTNDQVPEGTTYSGQTILISKPAASIATLIVNANGTYSFVANKPGKYVYNVPICIPPMVVGCPATYLELNVIDDEFTTTDIISNLEYSTTYADVDSDREGESITINVLSNDDCIVVGDCNLDASSLEIISGSNNGVSVVGVNGEITYTPNAGFIGKDTIKYKVCVEGDPSACSESYQVITINHVSSVNSIVAPDDFAYTFQGIEVTGSVLNNDSDPEGNTITIEPQGSIDAPIVIEEGSYYINSDGTFSFTPNDEFTGSTEIIYTVCDDADPSSCVSATAHILVFADMRLFVRVYLEGALMLNNGESSTENGRPLMRDDLRVSPYTGQNYIPMSDPYTYMKDPHTDTPSKFLKMGPGLIENNTMISDSLDIFSVEGGNAIVDWVHVELRSKDDYTVPIATRSGLLQRDGDVIDIDGNPGLRFNGLNVDSFYVVVKHRSHLGAMSMKVHNDELVDFTSPDFPVFNYGQTLDSEYDYSGLSMKDNVVFGYRALWAGDFDSDGKVKFTNPNDDQNTLYVNVLFSSPDFLINYDNAYGYFTGDYDMNSKAKYTNPQDDLNYLFSQVLIYPLNTYFLSNFDAIVEQVPSAE